MLGTIRIGHRAVHRARTLRIFFLFSFFFFFFFDFFLFFCSLFEIFFFSTCPLIFFLYSFALFVFLFSLLFFFFCYFFAFCFSFFCSSLFSLFLSLSLFLLGIELISATISKLNIIYVVTADDNLITRYVFNLAYLTLVTGDCGWDTVVSVHTRFLVFLLVLVFFVVQLVPQERILEHCWCIGVAAAKTDVERCVT